eukprot:8807366-Alexandrium_andersonii.AAC.1
MAAESAGSGSADGAAAPFISPERAGHPKDIDTPPKIDLNSVPEYEIPDSNPEGNPFRQAPAIPTKNPFVNLEAKLNETFK